MNRRKFLKYVGTGTVAVAGAAASAYYYSRRTSISETSTTSLAKRSTATYSRQQMPDFWKGVMFAQWLRGNDPYIEPGMRQLKGRLPVNGISLFVPYYTETPTSDKIEPIYDTGPIFHNEYRPRLDESWPPELIERTMDLAHSLGLQIAYWPCVGPITNGMAWEGALEPTPDVLKAYQAFKADQAALAEKHQCESFWVGNEWNRSYEHGDTWRQILEAVRSNFSADILVEFLYCDEEWWEQVLTQVDPGCFERMDHMGLSMNLYPLSSDYTGWTPGGSHTIKYNPTVAEIKARWIEHPIPAIESAYKRFGKPIIITELSAPSFDGAASLDYRLPNVWELPVDFQEQADLFEGAMRALTPLEYVDGVSWDFWDAFEPGLFYRGSEEDKRGILFQGKPAEKVLRFWYSKPDAHDGVGLLLTDDGHVDLENLKRETPLNELGKTRSGGVAE